MVREDKDRIRQDKDKVSSRRFSAVATRLESMADGIEKHQKDQNAVAIKADDIRKRKTELENRRQKYDQTLADARKAFDNYSIYYTDSRDTLSKSESTVYGRYGKRAPELADFGMKAWKKGGRRKGKGE